MFVIPFVYKLLPYNFIYIFCDNLLCKIISVVIIPCDYLQDFHPSASNIYGTLHVPLWKQQYNPHLNTQDNQLLEWCNLHLFLHTLSKLFYIPFSLSLLRILFPLPSNISVKRNSTVKTNVFNLDVCALDFIFCEKFFNCCR